MYPTLLQGAPQCFSFGMTVKWTFSGCFSAHLSQILQNPHQSVPSKVFIVRCCCYSTTPSRPLPSVPGHSGFINCLLFVPVSVVVQSFLFGIWLLHYP